MVPVSPFLNTIPSLCFKTSAALWFLSVADSAAAAVAFTPAVQERRGVRTLIDTMLLTHTIRLSWTLVPFSFLAGFLYSVSRRCPPHPDVRLETLP